jgi:acyl-CoA reductase-like NAD-dependent aldehyde dehydrogenase
VVAAIVPWNMPQFLIVTKLIPALLAGCCVVVKPAPESPLDALLLADLIEQADLPAGVVSVLPGDAEVGRQLIGHPGVDKVSFTGSTAAGRAVAAACAANLTRVSLELGG